MEWISYIDNKPKESDIGKLFKLKVTSRIDNSEYEMIGKWSGFSFLEREDEEDSWVGPVRYVQYYKRAK